MTNRTFQETGGSLVKRSFILTIRLDAGRQISTFHFNGSVGLVYNQFNVPANRNLQLKIQ